MVQFIYLIVNVLLGIDFTPNLKRCMIQRCLQNLHRISVTPPAAIGRTQPIHEDMPLRHCPSYTQPPTTPPPCLRLIWQRMFYRSEQLRPWTSFADAPFLLSIAAFKMSKPTIIWIWSWLYYSEIQDKGAGWRLFAFVFCCRDKALSSTDEELKAGSAYYSCA